MIYFYLIAAIVVGTFVWAGKFGAPWVRMRKEERKLLIDNKIKINY